jgi:hypothetical protein
VERAIICPIITVEGVQAYLPDLQAGTTTCGPVEGKMRAGRDGGEIVISSPSGVQSLAGPILRGSGITSYFEEVDEYRHVPLRVLAVHLKGAYDPAVGEKPQSRDPATGISEARCVNNHGYLGPVNRLREWIDHQEKDTLVVNRRVRRCTAAVRASSPGGTAARPGRRCHA